MVPYQQRFPPLQWTEARHSMVPIYARECMERFCWAAITSVDLPAELILSVFECNDWLLFGLVPFCCMNCEHLHFNGRECWDPCTGVSSRVPPMPAPCADAADAGALFRLKRPWLPLLKRMCAAICVVHCLPSRSGCGKCPRNRPGGICPLGCKGPLG